jgi:hypothetical protein
VDGSDIGRVTMLSRFPFKYAEAIARRDLRLHEQVYGSASEASIGRLRQVLQELGRAAEGSALSSRVRTAGALGQ